MFAYVFQLFIKNSSFSHTFHTNPLGEKEVGRKAKGLSFSNNIYAQTSHLSESQVQPPNQNLCRLLLEKNSGTIQA